MSHFTARLGTKATRDIRTRLWTSYDMVAEPCAEDLRHTDIAPPRRDGIVEELLLQLVWNVVFTRDCQPLHESRATLSHDGGDPAGHTADEREAAGDTTSTRTANRCKT